jgi:hypothetical protein
VHALAVPLLLMAAAAAALAARHAGLEDGRVLFGNACCWRPAYLLFIAGVGYYVRFFGGDWGGRCRWPGVCGLVMLVVLVLSGSMRARLRVFLGKNFFRYRYDYREEWLRFTAMLSTKSSGRRKWAAASCAAGRHAGVPGGRAVDEGARRRRYVQWPLEPAPRCRQRTSRTDSNAVPSCANADWIIDLDEYPHLPQRCLRPAGAAGWCTTDRGLGWSCRCGWPTT